MLIFSLLMHHVSDDHTVVWCRRHAGASNAVTLSSSRLFKEQFHVASFYSWLWSRFSHKLPFLSLHVSYYTFYLYRFVCSLMKAYNLFASSLFFTPTTQAFPTVLLTSNQLFTKGTFNPLNYTWQLPSLPTQPLSKPTAFFNYTIAGPL